MIENGRGIYHFPATKFNNTFSVLIPLKLLYSPETIKWKARAEYLDESDETSGSEFYLNYSKIYPSLGIESDASEILSHGAYFNDLNSGGIISFTIPNSSEGNIEYFSSYEKRLSKMSNNQFHGNGNGLSMIFARINGCYLIPKPLVIANGNYKLEGENTAFIFNTDKNFEGVTQVTDILSSIQKDLVGFYPHNGQLLIVEESDSNVLASPNTEFPVPVPLYLPASLEDWVWFYFAHEYGHHFHGGNLKMNQMLKDLYAESISSEIAYFAMEEVINDSDKYGIPNDMLTLIQNNLNTVRNNFLDDLSEYEQQGAPFEKLQEWPPQDFDPNNVFNGMILRIEEEYGRETVIRFFKVFQPAQDLVDVHVLKEIQPTNQNQKHTMFVVVWSIAAKTDLRPLFREWNFPIDEDYYSKVYPEIKEYLEFE
jgi:hypothetical protein